MTLVPRTTTGFRSSALDSREDGDEGGEQGHLIVANRGGGAARQEVEAEWKGNTGEMRAERKWVPVSIASAIRSKNTALTFK